MDCIGLTTSVYSRCPKQYTEKFHEINSKTIPSNHNQPKPIQINSKQSFKHQNTFSPNSKLKTLKIQNPKLGKNPILTSIGVSGLDSSSPVVFFTFSGGFPRRPRLWSSRSGLHSFTARRARAGSVPWRRTRRLS